MLKNCTKLLSTLLLLLSFQAAVGQGTVVWPTADAATIAASQFSDSSQIFKPTTAVPNPPAGFTGWVSKAISTSSTTAGRLINTQWDWARAGKGNKGFYWLDERTIASATAANGAAIFNSDYLDGSGLSASPHAADLISPAMNLAGQSNFTLVFNQSYRNFYVDATAITWSEDGGTTWKDTIDVFSNINIPVNNLINNLVSVKLPKSKGSANFKIKFIFSGDYYYWIIDDVKVVTAKNNLQINRDWVAIPQNLYVPRQQLDTIVFMSDVSNQGTQTATNVKLTVDIRDPNNVSVYNAVKNYGTIKADSVVENLVFGGWLPPSTGTGNVRYTGSYIISSDSVDNFTLNDTFRFPFFVSDSLFQNETGDLLEAQRITSPNWRIGNYFYFPKGGNVTATRITAILDTTYISGSTIVARLYSWNDANKDGLIQEVERTEVAAGEVVVPKLTTPSYLANFILQNTAGSGVIKLKDKTAYIAMVEFDQPSANVFMNAYFSRTNRMAPMRFATAVAGRPRLSAVVGNDVPANPWRALVFDPNEETYVPLVRMFSWPLKTDTKEPLSANNKIELFPNPTSSTLNVAFDLEKTEQAVLVRIIDMTGKIIKERDYTNLKKETISMDVNDVPNGVYNIQIQTIGNFRTMRFVKAN